MNIYQALVIQKDSYEQSAIEHEQIHGEHLPMLRGMILGTANALETVRDTLTVGDLCDAR